MKLYKIIANNTTEANRMAVGLVEASQWFEVTPLPYDEYEFVVKAENWRLAVELKTATPAEKEDSDGNDG